MRSVRPPPKVHVPPHLFEPAAKTEDAPNYHNNISSNNKPLYNDLDFEKEVALEMERMERQLRGQPEIKKDPHTVNLKDYKREGFPSEYAYAQAVGAMDLKPKQQLSPQHQIKHLPPQQQQQQQQQQQYYQFPPQQHLPPQQTLSVNYKNPVDDHVNSNLNTKLEPSKTQYRPSSIDNIYSDPNQPRRKGNGGTGIANLYKNSQNESQAKHELYAAQLKQQIEEQDQRQKHEREIQYQKQSQYNHQRLQQKNQQHYQSPNRSNTSSTVPNIYHGEIIEHTYDGNYDKKNLPPPSASLLQDIYGGNDAIIQDSSIDNSHNTERENSNYHSNKPPSGMLLGYDLDTQKALKKLKQDEYKRQLDEEKNYKNNNQDPRDRGINRSIPASNYNNSYSNNNPRDISPSNNQRQSPLTKPEYQSPPYNQLNNKNSSPILPKLTEFEIKAIERNIKKQAQEEYRRKLDAQVQNNKNVVSSEKINNNEKNSYMSNKFNNNNSNNPSQEQSYQQPQEQYQQPQEQYQKPQEQYLKPQEEYRKPQEQYYDNSQILQSYRQSSHDQYNYPPQELSYQQSNSYPNDHQQYQNRNDQNMGQYSNNYDNNVNYQSPSQANIINQINSNSPRSLTPSNKARERLIEDIYGNNNDATSMLNHNNQPVKDTWKPSGIAIDNKKIQAANEQKEALQYQINESKKRKEEELAKIKKQDEEDERRVRKELAIANEEILKKKEIYKLQAQKDNNELLKIQEEKAREAKSRKNLIDKTEFDDNIHQRNNNSAINNRERNDNNNILNNNNNNTVHNETGFSNMKNLVQNSPQRVPHHIVNNNNEPGFSNNKNLVQNSPQRVLSHRIQEISSPVKQVLPMSLPSPPRQVSTYDSYDDVINNSNNISSSREYGNIQEKKSYGMSKEEMYAKAKAMAAAEFQAKMRSNQPPVRENQYQMRDNFQPVSNNQSSQMRPPYLRDNQPMIPQSPGDVDNFLSSWQSKQRQSFDDELHNTSDLNDRHYNNQNSNQYQSNLSNVQENYNYNKVNSYNNYNNQSKFNSSYSSQYNGRQDSNQLRHSTKFNNNDSYDFQNLVNQSVAKSYEQPNDVSFVSESRLIPSNPWDTSGLLAALGPSVVNKQEDIDSTNNRVHAPNESLLNLSQIPAHASYSNHYAQQSNNNSSNNNNNNYEETNICEQSMTSDSMLLYLGKRTPVPSNTTVGTTPYKSPMKAIYENSDTNNYNNSSNRDDKLNQNKVQTNISTESDIFKDAVVWNNQTSITINKIKSPPIDPYSIKGVIWEKDRKVVPTNYMSTSEVYNSIESTDNRLFDNSSINNTFNSYVDNDNNDNTGDGYDNDEGGDELIIIPSKKSSLTMLRPTNINTPSPYKNIINHADNTNITNVNSNNNITPNRLFSSESSLDGFLNQNISKSNMQRYNDSINGDDNSSIKFETTNDKPMKTTISGSLINSNIYSKQESKKDFNSSPYKSVTMQEFLSRSINVEKSYDSIDDIEKIISKSPVKSSIRLLSSPKTSKDSSDYNSISRHVVTSNQNSEVVSTSPTASITRPNTFSRSNNSRPTSSSSNNKPLSSSKHDDNIISRPSPSTSRPHHLNQNHVNTSNESDDMNITPLKSSSIYNDDAISLPLSSNLRLNASYKQINDNINETNGDDKIISKSKWDRSANSKLNIVNQIQKSSSKINNSKPNSPVNRSMNSSADNSDNNSINNSNNEYTNSDNELNVAYINNNTNHSINRLDDTAIMTESLEFLNRYTDESFKYPESLLDYDEEDDEEEGGDISFANTTNNRYDNTNEYENDFE